MGEISIRAEKHGLKLKTLALDGKTRWDSTYKMLNNFIKLHPILREMDKSGVFNSLNLTIPNHSTKNNLIEYAFILKYIQRISKLVQDNNYVMLAMVPVEIVQLLEALCITNDLSPSVQKFQIKLHDRVSIRFNELLTTSNLALQVVVVHSKYENLKYIEKKV